MDSTIAKCSADAARLMGRRRNCVAGRFEPCSGGSRHSVTLTVHAEEMAELFVNGQSAGVGFWSPQTFELSGLLQEGHNELTLIVTGNMANLHVKRPVWYGLEQDAL